VLLRYHQGMILPGNDHNYSIILIDDICRCLSSSGL
jgi:hypothetical protein